VARTAKGTKRAVAVSFAVARRNLSGATVLKFPTENEYAAHTAVAMVAAVHVQARNNSESLNQAAMLSAALLGLM